MFKYRSYSLTSSQSSGMDRHGMPTFTLVMQEDNKTLIGVGTGDDYIEAIVDALKKASGLEIALKEIVGIDKFVKNNGGPSGSATVMVSFNKRTRKVSAQGKDGREAIVLAIIDAVNKIQQKGGKDGNYRRSSEDS
ncbi:MAG: hypothetical protein HY764_02635 [Candidatus Portnoybacteria bacterium]|nr:hypothetical protein [Candidatus Portnoybacteria bacterium]